MFQRFFFSFFSLFFISFFSSRGEVSGEHTHKTRPKNGHTLWYSTQAASDSGLGSGSGLYVCRPWSTTSRTPCSVSNKKKFQETKFQNFDKNCQILRSHFWHTHSQPSARGV
jgi:hypothetical protein